MKLLLDTNALWSRPLREALILSETAGLMADGRLTVAIPAVAYAERIRQLRRDGHDVETWKDQLAELGITVECLCAQQAERLGSYNDEEWARHGRDLLIQAHTRDGAVFVTDDAGTNWAPAPRLTTKRATETVRALLEGA